MKIQNALVSNIFDRSQRYFAHVTTVALSWPVQNIVVISSVHFTLECFEFSSNFEFDRNMLSGTGAWAGTLKNMSNCTVIHPEYLIIQPQQSKAWQVVLWCAMLGLCAVTSEFFRLILTHLSLDKMAAILHKQLHFHEWKVWYFYQNATEVCS